MQNSDYAAAIADALKAELGPTHQTVKTLMKWTDANERTAKNWLAGTHGPSGQHLIALLSYSDATFGVVMRLANRRAAVATESLALLRRQLLTTVAAIEDVITIR